MMKIKNFILALSCFAASGCMGIDFGPGGLADGIKNNAEALNDAHTKSIVAVISKNILRARDSQPTNYTTLSGIKSLPGVEVNGKLGFTPLGLGNAPGPFSGSNSEIGRLEKAAAEYTINPFANTGSNSLYRSYDPAILAHYLEAGWPPTVLAYLFVDSVTIDDPSLGVVGERFSIDGDAPDSSKSLMKNIIDGLEKRTMEIATVNAPAADRKCTVLSLKNFQEALQAKEIKTAELLDAAERTTGLKVEWDGAAFHACEPQKKYVGLRRINDDKVLARVRIRSFDDMIYFLGESIRLGDEGCFRDFGNLYLFKFSERDGLSDSKCEPSNENVVRGFATSLNYSNKILFVAPGVGIGEGKAAGRGVPDRTGTVLSLLSQLYLRAQSDEFLKAPESTTLRVN